MEPWLESDTTTAEGDRRQIAWGVDANHDIAHVEMDAQRLHPAGVAVALCVYLHISNVVVGVWYYDCRGRQIALGIDANHDTADVDIDAQRLHPLVSQ